MKKILVTLILFILFSVNVNAANTYFNVTKVEQGAPKCPESKLTLKVVGSDYSTGQGINFYNVYVDGKAYGQTFCMAPGKSRYVGGHTCQRTITPAKKESSF